MGFLVYEDKPRYDIWMRAVLVLPVAASLIPGLYSVAADKSEEALGLFFTAILIAFVLWSIVPRRYRIMNDSLKIAGGGPLSFSFSFDNIEAARTPKGISIGINFGTTFSSKNAVEIIRKKGMRVNITPGNRELFLDNMDKALNAWRAETRRA